MFEKRVSAAWALAGVLVVIGVLAWAGVKFKANLDFATERQNLRDEVRKTARESGIKLAEEELRLAAPLMRKSWRKGVLPNAERLGELRYRLTKVYDPGQSWKGGESLEWLQHEIAMEHASGLFHKNNPKITPVTSSQAIEAARGDEGWRWCADVAEKLHMLGQMDITIGRAKSHLELEAINAGCQKVMDDIKEMLKNGPPQWVPYKEDKNT